MKIIDFIFCDDIRLEVSNKHTLVGAYNDLLLLQTKSLKDFVLPTTVRLAMFVRIDLENENRVKTIEFNLNGNCIETFAGGFQLQILDVMRPLILVASGFHIVIKDQGRMNIEFVLKDESGTEIKRLKPDINFAVKFKEIP